MLSPTPRIVALEKEAFLSLARTFKYPHWFDEILQEKKKRKENVKNKLNFEKNLNCKLQELLNSLKRRYNQNIQLVYE